MAARKQPHKPPKRQGEQRKVNLRGHPEIPKGRNLTTTERFARDSYILQRQIEGWTWAQIAEDVGLSVESTKNAAKRRREALPDLIDLDPLQTLRGIIQGFQISIGDYERFAAAYAEKHPSAAIGAKKGADDARWRLLNLMQATGLLPRELGTVRWVIEARSLVKIFIQGLDEFEETIESEMKRSKPRKTVMVNAAKALSTRIESAVGAAEDG